MDQDRKLYLQTLVQFVISCRQQGHFLPYQDYQLLEEWLELAHHPNDLLAILDEQLPRLYRPCQKQGQPLPSLRSLQKLVKQSLSHHEKRRYSAVNSNITAADAEA